MKWRSRKFIVACFQLGITILLPPIYKLIGIDSDITMVCLTMSAGLTGLYLGANIVSKGRNGISSEDQ